MTQEHPITPPSELIEEWIELSRPRKDHSPNPNVLATYAARWGSDRELQLCLEWFQEFYKGETWVDKDLRAFMAARRPKPQSLKEKALEALKHAEEGWRPIPADCEIIRRALEQLPDDQG